MEKLCECGCGLTIKEGNRFVSGPHAWRGNHQSVGARRKMSEANKGKIVSAETRKRMSEAHKGKLGPWKGKHLLAETKRKISEARKGQPSPRKGVHLSAETKRKLSEAQKNFVREYPDRVARYWLGKKLSLDHRRKMSESHRGLGEKNPMKIFVREHPDKARENGIKGAFAMLASLRQNSPYYLDNVPFDSKGEKQAMIVLCKKFNLKPIEGVNCHVKVNGGEVDFRPDEKLFVEYHPYDWDGLTHDEYYNQRRKLLDSNGFQDCRLVVVQSLDELKGLVIA